MTCCISQAFQSKAFLVLSLVLSIHTRYSGLKLTNGDQVNVPLSNFFPETKAMEKISLTVQPKNNICEIKNSLALKILESKLEFPGIKSYRINFVSNFDHFQFLSISDKSGKNYIVKMELEMNLPENHSEKPSKTPLDIANEDDQNSETANKASEEQDLFNTDDPITGGKSQNANGAHWKSTIFESGMADSNCMNIEADEVKFYLLCVDSISEKILLYTQDHRDTSISPKIYSLNGDYTISSSSFEKVKGNIILYKDNRSINHVLIYVTNTKEEFFFRNFFYFDQVKFTVITVPVRNFIIDAMDFVNVNTDRESIDFLIINKRGGYRELIEMHLEFGTVDKVRLKEGFIHTHLDKLWVNRFKVYIAENSPTLNAVVIYVLGLKTTVVNKIVIENQKSIVKMIPSARNLLIITTDTNLKTQATVIELDTFNYFTFSSKTVFKSGTWIMINDVSEDSYLTIINSDTKEIKTFLMGSFVLKTVFMCAKNALEGTPKQPGPVKAAEEDDQSVRRGSIMLKDQYENHITLPFESYSLGGVQLLQQAVVFAEQEQAQPDQARTVRSGLG
jgi:hypothetical protein